MIRFRSLAVLATILASLPAAIPLGIGSAAAQQRCEGTFCDLYYSGSAPAPAAQPAAATPMTVPTMPSVANAGNFFTGMFSRSGSQAPAAAAPGAPSAQGEGSGLFRVGGGGITGQNRSSECGGTICDLFHGHSNETDNSPSASQSINGVPMSHYGNETASAEPVAVPAAMAPSASPSAASPQAERRVAVRTAPKPPACASKTGDPWACYRH